MAKQKTKKSRAKQEVKKQKKASKKKTAKAKKKTAKVQVDRCNRRVGTQGYLINSKINGTPQTVDQLCKSTKLPKGRVTKHVWDMCRKGFLKKNDKGGYSWAK